MPEKRYYWLKLHKDFFNQKEIKKLRRIAGGDVYTIIYLKMLLKSLETDGFLYFDGYYDSFVEELADDIDEDEKNVKIVVSYLMSKDLMVEYSESAYLLTKCQEMTGSEVNSARRVREHRERKKQEALQCNGVKLQCNSDVTKCNTEKEKELEKELEKEKKSAKLTDDFEKLWSLYPRKQGKKQAFEAYKRAIKDGDTNEQIEAGIKAYISYINAEHIQNSYIKQGSTYFNGRCWNDSYDISGVNNNGRFNEYGGISNPNEDYRRYDKNII